MLYIRECNKFITHVKNISREIFYRNLSSISGGDMMCNAVVTYLNDNLNRVSTTGRQSRSPGHVWLKRDYATVQNEEFPVRYEWDSCEQIALGRAIRSLAL